MSDETVVIPCNHCGAKLKVRAASQKVRCSKCQNVVDRSLNAGVASPQKSPGGRPQTTRAVPPPSPSASFSVEKTKPLGFFKYCWRSYSDTHTLLPWFLSGILGILLIPVVSFFKPLIGIKSIWYAFGVTALLALSLFTILLMLACMKYLFAKQRQIPEGHTTWLSAMTCFLLYISPVLGIVAAAETVGPDSGILVAVLPQLQKEQARFASFPTVKQPDTESTAEIVQAEEPSHHYSKPDKSESTNSFDSNSKGDGIQAVVAEGIGATADEAIKDAFRNAVRQVVGAVVDAETLIKNDEVIDDKVLTYSDGFIKTYEEVPDSRKMKDALHRIKIKAQVERRSIIAKLRTAKVALKEIDTTSLVESVRSKQRMEIAEKSAAQAQQVSTQQRITDAEKLFDSVMKELSDKLFEVSIDNQIETVNTTGNDVTIEYAVTVRPSMQLFTQFQKRLETAIQAVSTSCDEMTILAKERSDNANCMTAKFDVKLIPKQNTGNAIWLLTHANKTFSRTEWNVYHVVDKNNVMSFARRYSEIRRQIKVTLLGNDDTIVAVDRCNLDKDGWKSLYYPYVTSDKYKSEQDVQKQGRVNESLRSGSIILSPYICIDIAFRDYKSDNPDLWDVEFVFNTSRVLNRRLTLDADDVVRIKKMRAELVVEQ